MVSHGRPYRAMDHARQPLLISPCLPECAWLKVDGNIVHVQTRTSTHFFRFNFVRLPRCGWMNGLSIDRIMYVFGSIWHSKRYNIPIKMMSQVELLVRLSAHAITNFLSAFRTNFVFYSAKNGCFCTLILACWYIFQGSRPFHRKSCANLNRSAL